MVAGEAGNSGDNEFCGIENTISSEELLENEAGVHEDVFVVGQKLAQESDLVVELGVFVDEQLWRHFSSRHGALAWQKLQQYALTMLSNIQASLCMFNQSENISKMSDHVQTADSSARHHLSGCAIRSVPESAGS